MWDDDERKGEGETRCRLIACYSRKKVNTYKTINLYYRLYCMVVKLGLSPSESRKKYLGRYLGLREMKLQENGEYYIMLSKCIILFA